MNLVNKLKKECSSFFKKTKQKALPYFCAGVMAFTPPMFYGCGGGSEGGSGEGNGHHKQEEKVVLLDDDAMNQLESYENGTLTFSESTPQLDSLSSGDAICISPSDVTPYGLFREITDI